MGFIVPGKVPLLLLLYSWPALHVKITLGNESQSLYFACITVHLLPHMESAGLSCLTHIHKEMVLVG